MKFRLPLTLSLSLMIVLLLAIQAVAMIFYNVRDIEKKLKQDTQKELLANANSVQGFVEFLYTKQELNQVQDEITAMAGNPRIKLAILLDDNNRIVASSRREFDDSHIDQIESGDMILPQAEQIDQVRQSLRPRMINDAETNEFLIMQPLVMGTSETSLRPDKIGVLFLQSNMAMLRKQFFEDVLLRQTPVWVLMVLFTGLVVFIFYLVYIKRLKHISMVAQQVGMGDYQARANLQSYDEIGFLGKFFNRMLDSVNEQQTALFNALDELERRERNLDMTLQSIGDAVITTDAAGLVTRMNPVATSLTGWSEDEARGVPLEKVFRIVNARNRDSMTNPVTKVLETGKVVGLANHTALISKDGREYQIADSAAPIRDEAGNIFGIILVFHDVTHQYEMQQEIEESEQRLQLALNAIEAGVWDWNVATGEVYYSHAWSRLLGYEPGEIALHVSTWESSIHPDDRALVLKDLNKHLRGEIPQFEVEHRLIRKNGEYFWCLGRGKVVKRDENGHPLRVIGTASDISDLVAERAIQQQRVEQSSLNQQALMQWASAEFASSGDVYKLATELAARTLCVERASVWLLNETGDAIRYEALYTLSDQRHQYGVEIRRSGNEDYFIPPHQSSVLVINDALNDPITAGYLDSYIKPNHITSLLDVAIVIQGRLVGVLSHECVGEQHIWTREQIDFAIAMAHAIALEIEAQQRRYAEKALDDLEQTHKEILDHLVDGVISIDQYGIVLSCNRGAVDLFGYEQHEVIGRNVKMLMPQEIAEHHDGFLKNYMTTGIARVIGIGREVTGRRKNGTTFPLRLSVSEIPPDSEGRRRFVGNCSDITQERHREEMLRRTQKMDALGKLTGGIAHDYNNMLGVILGYGDLLQDLYRHDPKANKYIDAILNAAERGKNLTQSLLAFTRHRETVAESININDVLHQDEHMLAKTLTAKIQLHLDLEESLWKVYIDKGELEDAILNIVINAMHAMPEGGHLTITTENEKISEIQAKTLGISPGNYVVLAITDSGCGIPEDYLHKVFDPFFTTKGELGTGLGLSQVYGFMQRSKGCIDVASEVDVGTQIVMYFPQDKGETHQRGVVELSKPSHYAGHETILVVDDEPSLRELSYEILTAYGYTVLLAASAEEALEILRNTSIDLMISDVIMPGMDGFQLASMVRQTWPDIKIQMVSGYNDQHQDKDNRELVNQLLRKPYQTFQLLESVRKLLG
ncbi:MAG: PAS domain S-box protein [Gammaproteobacteria bacterium]|nr:MAG: PAS domain S-box protein [Gammaproteobacteria bacterium]